MRIISLITSLLLPAFANAAGLVVQQAAPFGTVTMGQMSDIAGNQYPINVIGNVNSGVITTAPVDAVKGLSVNVTGLIGQGSTTSGQTGLLALGAVSTGNPSYTNALSSPLSIDPNGGLRVNVIAGGGGTSSFGAAFPASGQAIGAKNGANMVNLTADGSNNLNININAASAAPLASNITQVAGAAIAQGHGTAATAIRVELPTDGTGVVTLGAGTASVGAVTASQTITNPTSTLTMTSATTAYTAGQLIATSATAGSVVNPSVAIATSAGGAILSRVRLDTNDSTSTAWGGQTVRVDFWTTTPTWTNGDRAAWSPATQTGAHLAAYTCTMSAEYGDGAFSECAPTVGNYTTVKLASGTSLFWSLDAITGSGVTGASKVWTLTAELLN